MKQKWIKTIICQAFVQMLGKNCILLIEVHVAFLFKKDLFFFGVPFFTFMARYIDFI